MPSDQLPSTGNSWPANASAGPVMNRRDLLKGATALGLGAGLSAAGLAATTSAASSQVLRPSGRAPIPWNGQQVNIPYGVSYEGTPKRGGQLTWAFLYEPIPQMDPQLPAGTTTGAVDQLLWLYDQLTNMKAGQLTNVPGLAESWEVNKGGLEYVFHLRDAEFSNGDPVTAADVQYSLERFNNPKINGDYYWISAIDTIEALNTKTVRVTLKYVQGWFIQVVGHGATGIVNKRVHEKLGADFGQHPVGSGPFVFDSKVPGESITFKRNPNYWKTPTPYIDEFTLNYVPDDNARMLEVTSGRANVGYPVPYALVETYKDYPGTRLQMEPYTNLILVIPNIQRAPFNETNVRLALNYATPREGLNEAIFKNSAVLANSTIGQLQYWDPSVPPIPYDLDRAKAYLAKSSVPRGFSATLLIVGTDTDSVDMAGALGAAWGEIGVQLTTESVDINTLDTLVFGTPANYDICFIQPDWWSSDVGYSDEIAELLCNPRPLNFGGFFYYSPYAANLVNQATHSINQSLRKKDFVALQKYCLTVDPPVIPIAFGPNRTLVSSKVQGLATVLNCSWRLEEVWLND